MELIINKYNKPYLFVKDIYYGQVLTRNKYFTLLY